MSATHTEASDADWLDEVAREYEQVGVWQLAEFRENMPVAYAGFKAAIQAHIDAECNRARVEAVAHIMGVKTEGLFDNGDLFIKRAPVEQACIDVLGYEAFAAIKESLPVADPTQQPQERESK